MNTPANLYTALRCIVRFGQPDELLWGSESDYPLRAVWYPDDDIALWVPEVEPENPALPVYPIAYLNQQRTSAEPEQASQYEQLCSLLDSPNGRVFWRHRVEPSEYDLYLLVRDFPNHWVGVRARVVKS